MSRSAEVRKLKPLTVNRQLTLPRTYIPAHKHIKEASGSPPWLPYQDPPLGGKPQCGGCNMGCLRCENAQSLIGFWLWQPFWVKIVAHKERYVCTKVGAVRPFSWDRPLEMAAISAAILRNKVEKKLHINTNILYHTYIYQILLQKTQQSRKSSRTGTSMSPCTISSNGPSTGGERLFGNITV